MINAPQRTLFIPSSKQRYVCTMSHKKPDVSIRITQTDDPIIYTTKQLVQTTPGCVSLAQGVVHWMPPSSALERAASMITDPSCSAYGPDEGMPALREALRHKLLTENNLHNYDVHVTAGANQAFTNIVVSLLDPTDKVVLFLPYYFNHRMAIQMTGGADSIIYGPCDPVTFHPDLDWLERTLLHSSNSPRPKMVVIVNPNNPTGVNLTRDELQRATNITEAAGSWLVMDNTYEHFIYHTSDQPLNEHVCIGAPHVVHVFSFSKAFGMMGFRQGYIAYYEDDTRSIGSQLVKVQDTVPICAAQISQHVSLGALAEGRSWVTERVEDLQRQNRAIVLKALEPLGTPGHGIAPSEGAIYLWAKLPASCAENDELVLQWLVKKHKICVIPGSACGYPGYIRVAFANLLPRDCKVAAGRLRSGLEELVSRGIDGVKKDLDEMTKQ